MGNFCTKLKFYALFGYLIFFGLKAYALTNFDEAQLFSMNVIQNGGFESDKAFWLQTSGQAFFVTSVQSEVGSGLKSAKLMGPGLQRIKGELFPIPNSMKTSTTCILRCQWLNTTGAVGSCYAEDSGGVPILGASISLAAGANWQQSDVSFTCPASGSFRAVVEATPGSGNSVFVDQIYIGPTVTGVSGGGGGLSPTLNQNWVFVGNAGNIATGVPMTGDVSIISSGATSIADSVVTGKLLTGLPVGVNTPILATDTILQAFANLQAQISGSLAGANTTLSNLVSPTAVNQDLLPGSSILSLGAVSNEWAALWVRSIASSNGLQPLTIRHQATNSAAADIEISTANNNSATDSGEIQIFSGNNTNPGGGTGDIVISTGDASNAALVGDIYLRSGGVSGKGEIFFDESSLASASNGYVWTLQNSLTGEGAWVPGATTTGTPLTFAGYDALGNLFTIPTWAFTSLNGLNVVQTLTPAPGMGPTYPVQHEITDIIGAATPVSTDVTQIMFRLTGILNNTNQFGSSGAGGLVVHQVNARHDVASQVGSLVNLRTSSQLDGLGTMDLLYSMQDQTAVINGYVLDFMTGLELNPQVDAASTLTDSVGISLSGIYNGTTNSITGVRVNPNGSGTIGSHVGYTTAPGFSTALNSVVNFEATGNYSAPANYVGLSVTPTHTGTGTNAAGIRVDMSGVNPTNRAYGLLINQGTLNAGGNYTSGSSLFVDLINQISTNFTTPVALTGTDIAGTSSILNAVITNDIALGPAGFGLAAHIVGGSIAVTSGDTVDQLSGVVIGFSIPGSSTGGTIDKAVTLGIGGLLNAGGSLVVNEQYGIQMQSGASSYATDAWGFSIEDSVENYIAQSLVIGGLTKKVTNSSVGLEVNSTTRAFLPSRMTTAQRNALTAVDGMVIYNSSTNKLQGRINGAWINLDGGLVNINALPGTAVTAAVTINPGINDQRSVYNVFGNGGPQTMTANPQIGECNSGNEMKELVVRGTSNVNTVTFSSGNGLKLQSASKTLGDGGTLNFYCDGTDWIEK